MARRLRSLLSGTGWKASALTHAANLVLGITCALAGGQMHAQDLQAPSPSNPSAPITAFPTPSATGTIGNIMPTALSELAAHLQSVSATGWTDLQATGAVTYSGSEHANSATLILASSGLARLDIAMESGTRSLRIKNQIGAFLDESGHQAALVSETSNVGIVAFPRIWSGAPLYPRSSLLDRGLYQYQGQTLHRVTIEFPSNPDVYTAGDPTVATDLYFDLSTHLLIYSVDAVSFTNSYGLTLDRVTHYDAYQSFGGVLVPTTMQQALDGQLQWSMQISQVTINSNPDPSLFSF